MPKRTQVIAWLVICLVLMAACQAVGQIGNFPAVVVSSDGAGDFGPQTAGTATSGIQEALYYCVTNHRDLYIRGGPGITYTVSGTITVPAARDTQIFGGQYTLVWNGPSNADLLVVNSARNCNYSFGVLQYGGTGAAIRVKPVDAVPGDGSAGFTDSEITVGYIAPAGGCGGTGAFFDTTSAQIAHSKFTFFGIRNYTTCLYAPYFGSAFSYNMIKCMRLYSEISGAGIASVGGQSRYNDFKLGAEAKPGTADVTGVRIAGDNNTIEVLSRGGFAANSDLIFDTNAEGNRATISYPNTMTDPTTLIGDYASNPTNRVIFVGAHSTLPIRTVPVTTGTFMYLNRLYPVIARVTGGSVSAVRLIRGATIEYGASPGDILLNVGDPIQIVSTSAPTLTIIPQPGN